MKSKNRHTHKKGVMRNCPDELSCVMCIALEQTSPDHVVYVNKPESLS